MCQGERTPVALHRPQAPSIRQLKRVLGFRVLVLEGAPNLLGVLSSELTVECFGRRVEPAHMLKMLPKQRQWYLQGQGDSVRMG